MLAVMATAAACSKGRSDPAHADRLAPLVTVATVQKGDLPITMRAPVDLRPLVQADVGSKTLGYLDAVLVDRGDRVRRGQLVALVRPSDLPDQLAAARGRLAQAQSAATLARTSYERVKALGAGAVVSQQEVQQTESTMASALANEDAIRAQIAALGVRLGETKIESPLTGMVSARRLDPGALVGPTTGAMLTVVRVDTLRVFIPVTEKAINSIAVGKDAVIELDAVPGKKFGGKVVRVAPAFDPTTRTLEAEVQLPNDSGELRPGMYGRAEIVLEVHPGALTVPVEAIRLMNDRRFVYVYKDGAVHRREVTGGFETESSIEITRGLSPGEEVVVAGLDMVTDGAQVRTPAPRP